MLDGAKLVNSPNSKGIEVESISDDSPAKMIGLNEGDLIIGVNKTRTKNLAELRNIFKDQQGIFALNIIRGNSSLYLMLR